MYFIYELFLLLHINSSTMNFLFYFIDTVIKLLVKKYIYIINIGGHICSTTCFVSVVCYCYYCQQFNYVVLTSFFFEYGYCHQFHSFMNAYNARKMKQRISTTVSLLGLHNKGLQSEREKNPTHQACFFLL